RCRATLATRLESATSVSPRAKVVIAQVLIVRLAGKLDLLRTQGRTHPANLYAIVVQVSPKRLVPGLRVGLEVWVLSEIGNPFDYVVELQLLAEHVEDGTKGRAKLCLQMQRQAVQGIPGQSREC